jgi:hypothetical protein
MILSDVAAVAGIFSSAAVAVSLVYLALQVRQAEKNQKALMQQARADRSYDILLRMSDPSLSRVLSKGRWLPEQLTFDEVEQFFAACHAMFRNHEDTFLQHKAGMLNDMTFRSAAQSAKGMFGWPGHRVFWLRSRDAYIPEFVAFMDGLMEEQPFRPPFNSDYQDQMLSHWRAAVSALDLTLARPVEPLPDAVLAAADAPPARPA